MGIRHVVVLAGLVACTKAGPSGDPGAGPPTSHAAPAVTLRPPAPAPTPPPPAPPVPPAPASPAVTVQMTAATLADDCGGSAPRARPPAPAKSAKWDRADADVSARGAKAKRQCEQTSMQLSIVSKAGGGPTELRVKKVEIFDEKGTSLGELTARSPTVWSAQGSYVAWDENIAPAQELSVSYVLSQPAWGPSTERWNKTYVVKAVVSVGGADRTVGTDVLIAAPASLPANVKT